jgi:tetratricopeptide (TPR) repeat protein
LARVDLADLLIKTSGAQSALQLLDDAPAGQKRSLPVLLKRNWALLALGRFADARQGIETVLAAGSAPEAMLQDAALRVAQKDYSGARAVAEKILSRNPGDVGALTTLVQTYSAQKQLPAAVAKLREYAARQSKSPEVNQYLGHVLARSGDVAGARAAFEVAARAQPGFLPAELALAQLDRRDGKRDEARNRLSAVISTHPTNVDARLLLAEVEIAEGNMADAMKQYNQIIDLDPRNAGALNNVAYMLADGAQVDEALKYAQQAKQLAPENPAIDDTLGWAYYKKGMYQQAAAHLESATARGDSALRKYHLAMAYLKAGDPERGKRTLEAALKIDPSLPEAKAARDVFKSKK